jgi:predicted nucleotidyltransferase
MLSEANKQIIINAARRYNVTAVYLFGSSLKNEPLAQDIDLGVLGVPPVMFFDFYAELVKDLPQSVALIDLSKPTLFNRLVLRDGVTIYG